MLFIGNMVTSLKHHVFKKMGEAAFINFFPCTSHMVGYIHMYDRVAVVFMYDQCQAIRENILFKWNYQFIPFFFNFFYQASLAKLRFAIRQTVAKTYILFIMFELLIFRIK